MSVIKGKNVKKSQSNNNNNNNDEAKNVAIHSYDHHFPLTNKIDRSRDREKRRISPSKLLNCWSGRR